MMPVPHSRRPRVALPPAGKAFIRSILVGLMLAGPVLAGSSSASTAEVPQASHRAFYSLGISNVKGSSGVVAIGGAMTSEWERGCEGWTGTQQLSVTMERQEGAPVVSEVSASVFESHDGTRLRFTSRTVVNDETVERVRGRASRSGPEAAGRATYLEPEDLVIDLPPGTLFPYQHTLSIIEAATSGTGRDFSSFFDGSQPEETPQFVHSLILGAARPAGEGPGAGLGPLSAHRWWPVRLAFFAQDNGNGEPEIEMTQFVQENGVVRRFDFDYGNFTVVATLVRLQAIPLPDCR